MKPRISKALTQRELRELRERRNAEAVAAAMLAAPPRSGFWRFRAGENITAKDLVTVGADRTVRRATPEDQALGFAMTGAKAGEEVDVLI